MQKMKRILSIVVTVCMLVSILATGVLALTITDRPANGTTKGQPFAAGTGGSTNFRIPGIVTLDNGTLIAACDARWNHAGDGAGLDTIVSVSTDNGENWTYTFANYLGDNGNTYNNLSTCFIDPGIGTDGEKAYLIADLWPAGIALNTSKYSPVAGENGFDSNGNLLLRALADDTVAIGGSGYNTMAAVVSRYTYYLDLDTLTLHNADGSEIEGYTVDAYFNITGNGVNTNLFFADSPYQPYPTDYLYMTTSTDGLNWSVPELLNLKEESEQTLLVGPGNGTYDKVNDRMIFTAYEHSSGYERACLIWMDSEGSWHRSEDATSSTWSSEATSVVLDDGTVRCFYRDGYTSLRYTDYVFDESVGNYVVSAREVTTAATVDSGCQLTSILYSEQIDGKDVILVAGPTSYRRINGYIYVFLVDEDNSMELAYAHNVTPDAYAYSCLTELSNGDIGLLYENAGSSIKFVRYAFDEIANRENDPRLTFKEFELLTGDSKSFTDNSGYYGDADISELDTTVATLTMTGEEVVTDAAQLGSNASYNGDTIDLADCLYNFAANEDGTWVATSTDADGNTVYLYPGHSTSSGYPNAASSNVPLQIFEGYEEDTFNLYTATSDNTNGSASYLYFDRSGLRWDRVSSFNNREDWMINCSLRLYKPVEGAGSAEIPGYERVTELSAITEGEYLVVGPGSDGNLYALYPNTSTANRYCQLAKLLGRTTVGHTELTFTGVGPGYTEVQVGSVVYQITVADVTEVNVEIPVGNTVSYIEPNGNYADTDTSALDTSVATVTLKGVDGTADNGLSLAPVSTLTDGTYVILNTRANKLVTNAPASAAAAAGAGSGLNMSGTIRDEIESIALWTITAVDGGYTIQDQDGNYMTIGSTTAGVTATPTTLALNWRGSSWTIAKDGAYLNHFGGGSSTCAAGWQDGSAAGDAGSQFAIYAYSEEPVGASTEVTFTGVNPGTTELLVGRTRYLITVSGAVHDVQLEVGETASYVIAGDQTGADVSALDPDVATVELSLATVAHVSNGTGYNSEAVELADCLYTFTATADGYYEVSATAADGTTVYLNHYASGNNNPNITAPGKIDVQTSSHTNMFKLVAQVVSGGSGATRGLHFHAEAAMPYWNRCGNDTSTRCHEYLYRPVREGEESSAEINGYVLVTDIAEVVDGGQYLIVHNSEVDDDLYILHPTTSTDKWAHVAKLAPATKVTFTGVAVGETALTLSGHIFNITVTAGEQPHEHSWSDWTVTTEPTCTEKGVETRTCECGETETREVAALGHDFVDGVCTRCGEVEETPAENPFVDVNEDNFFYDSVMWAVEKGVTAGVDATHFGPAVDCGRAQVVTFLWRAAGSPEPETSVNPFEDVTEADYFYKAVLWAMENGITAGVDATHFGPTLPCTRGQVVTFLWRAVGAPEVDAESTFTDVTDSGAYYYDAVLWAVENGVTAGMGDGTFGVSAVCNRAQVVTFLYHVYAE